MEPASKTQNVAESVLSSSRDTTISPIISRRPREPEADDSGCDRCKEKKLKSGCKVIAANNLFECTRCITNSVEVCSFARSRLRFFATDFSFRNEDYSQQKEGQSCTACNALCFHAGCDVRRRCTSDDSTYGWCDRPELHRLYWDVENQPDESKEDYMKYYYRERPEEYAAPWAPLYVRKVLEDKASSPYLLTPAYHKEARRTCLDVNAQAEVKICWDLERLRSKPPEFLSPSKERYKVDLNVNFCPGEEVMTCRRVCSLYAFMDLSNPTFQRHSLRLEPGLYTIKWKLQLFTTNISKRDQKLINRHRLSPLRAELDAATKDVADKLDQMTYDMHDALDGSIYNAHGVVQHHHETLAPAIARQKRAIAALEHLEDQPETDRANPFNFPNWRNNSQPDRPSRPALCFGIGYALSSSESVHASAKEYQYGRGAPLLADQALEKKGRVLRWLDQHEYFALRDQGWIGLVAEGFRVKERSPTQPVLVVCNVDNGNWCGGFRFGGVDLVRTGP